jgi:hypothetical protein
VTARRRTAIALRTTLGVVGVVAAGGVAEIVLRLTAYHAQFVQPDATIGYVLAPRFERRDLFSEHPGSTMVFRTNNLGLRRDGDTAVPKPADTRRVLVLGDSQSEGIVENRETYSAGVERRLNAAPFAGATRVEVLNAAVSGYSPVLEYLWWQERGRALQPDLIVLALYVGNDVAELAMHHEDFGGFGPPFAIASLEPAGDGWQIVPPGSAGGPLSRLDCVLETYLRSYALIGRVLRRIPSGGTSPLLAALRKCPGCLQSLWQAYVAHGDPSALADDFGKLDYVLKQFQADSARLNVPVVVLVIPTKLEVEGQTVKAQVDDAARALGLRYEPAAFDDAVRERMLSLARAHSFITVDLLAPLRMAAGERHRALFWARDWHLNIDGHDAVAHTLAPVILEQLTARTR